MTETPDALEFDLISAISGRDMPSEEVPICFDDVSAYAVFKLSRERDNLLRQTLVGEEKDRRDEAVARLEEEIKSYQEKAQEKTYTFHLTAVLPEDREAILDELFEQFPEERDTFGRTKPNKDRDNLFRDRLWAATIRKVVNHEGKEFTNVTPEWINELTRKSPDSATVKLRDAIVELSTGTSAGFEQVVKGVDFLS